MDCSVKTNWREGRESKAPQGEILGAFCFSALLCAKADIIAACTTKKDVVPEERVLILSKRKDIFVLSG